MKKIVCHVCEMEFLPDKKYKYLVEKENSFLNNVTTTCEAFDCPYCSCQNIVGRRFKEIRVL